MGNQEVIIIWSVYVYIYIYQCWWRKYWKIMIIQPVMQRWKVNDSGHFRDPIFGQNRTLKWTFTAKNLLGGFQLMVPSQSSSLKALLNGPHSASAYSVIVWNRRQLYACLTFPTFMLQDQASKHQPYRDLGPPNRLSEQRTSATRESGGMNPQREPLITQPTQHQTRVSRVSCGGDSYLELLYI